MTDVRITDTTPVVSDFVDHDNSPIVIDESTSIAYYLKDDVVTPIQATAGLRFITTTATLDFPSTAANSNSDLTVTLTGVTENNTIMLGPPSTIEAQLTAIGFVSSDNTVTVRIHNTSSGAVDPASATWRVSAFI